MIQILAGIFVLLIAISQPVVAQQTQETPAAEPRGDRYFSGVVTALAEDSLTVSRTALGKDSTRTFLITSETKVEGKLRVKARVTVKFVATDEGDKAVDIRVRSAQKK